MPNLVRRLTKESEKKCTPIASTTKYDPRTKTLKIPLPESGVLPEYLKYVKEYIKMYDKNLKSVDEIKVIYKKDEQKKKNTVPNECYKEFGNDLDSCSTQENEGCGRCILYKEGE